MKKRIAKSGGDKWYHGGGGKGGGEIRDDEGGIYEFPSGQGRDHDLRGFKQ